MSDYARVSGMLDEQAERIRELEDALIDELGEGGPHRAIGPCPVFGFPRWSRDPECPACQRLERLLGHRRPAS